MLNPKTTANTTTGTTTKIASVAPSRPKTCTPAPRWNTSTISPKVAPTASEFMITALSGTRIERKAMASIKPVTLSTSRMSSGNCLRSRSWESTLPAM